MVSHPNLCSRYRKSMSTPVLCKERRVCKVRFSTQPIQKHAVQVFCELEREREEALKLSLSRGCTMGRNQTYFFSLLFSIKSVRPLRFLPLLLDLNGFSLLFLFFCFFVRHLALSHHHGRISLQASATLQKLQKSSDGLDWLS